jgi:hypothetical protein
VRFGGIMGLMGGYPTPEEAALAEWREIPQAKPRVLSVEYQDNHHAVVITDTKPSHPMWNYCVLTAEGWVYTGDHN